MLLADAGLAPDARDGAERIVRAVQDGRAAERFGAMVAAQGGPARFVEEWPRLLPEATVIREIPAPRSGCIAAIDGEALGLAVVALGGGRQVETDQIDPSVGLSGLVRLGDPVMAGAPLGFVHAAREDAAAAAAAAVQAAVTIADTAPPGGAGPLVLERIG